MLQISFINDSDGRVVQALQTKGPRIVAALMTKLTALMVQLASYVVAQKLSGQVLHRRTGVLAGSVTAIPATAVGTQIVGAVEAAAPPAGYGWAHELGGTRAYEIVATRARVLSFVVNGKQVFAKRVIHPPMPQRPFLNPSLDENAANIESELRGTVDVEINRP